MDLAPIFRFWVKSKTTLLGVMTSWNWFTFCQLQNSLSVWIKMYANALLAQKMKLKNENCLQMGWIFEHQISRLKIVFFTKTHIFFYCILLLVIQALSIWTYKMTWSSRCNFFQKMSKKLQVLDQVHFKKNDWISPHL